MQVSRTGLSKKAGVLSATVAALGLLFGLMFVAPAGAQDGGDSYTTAGPSGDTTGATTGGTTGPSDVGADSAVPPSGPSGPSGPNGVTTGGGVPGGATGGVVPGGATSGGAIPVGGVTASGVPITSSGPLARTGFGATLPSLLATALVAGGAMLVIAVSRRRRTN